MTEKKEYGEEHEKSFVVEVSFRDSNGEGQLKKTLWGTHPTRTAMIYVKQNLEEGATYTVTIYEKEQEKPTILRGTVRNKFNSNLG